MALLVMKPTIVATLTVQLSLLIISSIISLSKCDQTTEITSKIVSNKITIDLHHLDLSSSSPLYDPSSSHYQRVANALQRSSAHANPYLASKQTPAAAPTIEYIDSSYFLDYSIGNPSVALKGILDTGSDLIWTSCSNVSGSTSLKPITCNKISQCNTLLPGSTTTCSQGRCSYQMTYGDGSSSAGYLSTDTITLGSVQFPNITFGCGTNNLLSNGVVGLGGGAVSLVKQIGYGQFSYCLVSFDSKRSNSKLHLGDSAAAVVQGATSIPLVIDSQTPTFYNVKLASITVGGGQIPFGQNMILDTGTGATRLPATFHSKLLNALRTSIGTNNVTDPNGGPFGLCYSSDPTDKFPEITLNFDNNVGVKWKQENIFAKLGPVIVWCFAAYPIDDRQEAIFGNLAQVNYLVGFDLNEKTVTMQPTDCGSSS